MILSAKINCIKDVFYYDLKKVILRYVIRIGFNFVFVISSHMSSSKVKLLQYRYSKASGFRKD